MDENKAYVTQATMEKDASARVVRVALVVVPETAPAGLYSLLEVFASVGSVWELFTGNALGEVRMRVDLVAETQELAYCAMGVPVEPDQTVDSAGRYDCLIVSDLFLSADFDPRGRWPAMEAWIHSQHADGAIVASVCTGALLLAETGLLDNLEATSHWGAVPLIQKLYPRVRLRPERVLALAGPGQRIITAGGASSWIELALYLIAHYCGRQEAVRISKVFLLGDHADGQLPFAALTRPPAHTDQVIEHCQRWIAENYDVANPVERVAAYSGLHARTFKRRFRAATGFSPLEYIQTLRVEEAKFLLESCDLAADDIGAEVGYADSASFRRLFKRLTGVTPSRYRRRYQRIGRVES